MNSIAIWWPTCDDCTLKVHVDINIWLDREKKNNYIEFGLKLSSKGSVDKLFMFFPFTINVGDIKDKIEKLSEGSLTNALFNDRLKIGRGDGGSHSVEFSSGEHKGDVFRYCQLNELNDIEIENISENERGNVGTKLIVKLKEESPRIETDYYRFRINTSLDQLLRTSNENLFILDGLFKKVSYLEFCLNSTRKLPSSITDELSSGHKLSSMNLFLLTDTYTNYIFQSKTASATRMLERHIWNKYLGKGRTDESIIANHWKANDIHEYNLFVKIKYLKKSLLSVAVAVIALVALGAASGVTGNMITKYLSKETVPVGKPASEIHTSKNVSKKVENDAEK